MHGPEGLLVVGLSSSFVEEPVAPSVAVSVLSSVDEVLLVLVDDDAPDGLLEGGL